MLDHFPDLATVALVPLGVSRYTTEAAMRAHTREEAIAVVEAVAEWQPVFLRALGRRLVYAADEYYLLAGWPFPPAEEYDGFVQHENGIGMARAFEVDLVGADSATLVGNAGHTTGFFQWVGRGPGGGLPGAADVAGAEPGRPCARRRRGRPDERPPVVLTGEYGAAGARAPARPHRP